MGFKPIPAPIVEKQLRNTPAMSKFLASVAREAAVAVDGQTPEWVKRSGSKSAGQMRDAVGKFVAKGAGAKSITRGGARINDGNVEGYVAQMSSFWHIPEFGTAYTPATAPLRRGTAEVLRAHGGDLKEQDA